MEKQSLGTLPAEILEYICADLLDDEEDAKQSLLALSCSSRRLRAIAIPYIFREITGLFWNSYAQEYAGKGHPHIRTLASLLRTFITNPQIAAEVKDITEMTWGTCDVDQEVFDLVAERATALGVTLPVLLRPGDCGLRPGDFGMADCGLSTGVNTQARLARNHLRQFLVEMLLVHTPNLRSIEYRAEDRGTSFAVFAAAARRAPPRPLFSRLQDVTLENFGAVANVQGLAEAAPNLDSLWLEYVYGPTAGVRFDSVRVLLLTQAMFDAQEFGDLICGFPNLKKLWFTRGLFDGDDMITTHPVVLMTPQDAVDALEPVRSQLTELTLRSVSSLWHDLDAPERTSPVPGLITSLKSLEVLEDLDVEGECLWDRKTQLYAGYDAGRSRFFEKLLPKSLKTLTLRELQSGPFEDDVTVLTSCVEECCPELKTIRYEWAHTAHASERGLSVERRLERLKGLFAARGVAFKAMRAERPEPPIPDMEESIPAF